MSLKMRAAAEFLGTFWLVFAGCGAVVMSATFPELGIGFLGIALTFGLALLTMGYTIGHISGCHLNPAVSIGLTIARRFSSRDLPWYVAAQVAGSCMAAVVLYAIASGKPGFYAGGLASNGYVIHSPGGYALGACAMSEALLTFMFVMIVLGATDEHVPSSFTPIAIGLGLTLVHLPGIAVTGLSVNPARSTGPALVAGGWAIEQLWLFWLAPIIGATIAGMVYPLLSREEAVETAPTRPRLAA